MRKALIRGVLAALIGTTSVAVVRVQAQAETTASAAAADVETAPVEIDGTVLFTVRGVSSLPANVRANLIGTRVIDAAVDTGVPVSSVEVVNAGGTRRIVAGGRLIMLISDSDATLEGVSASDLAAAHAIAVQQAITSYREARAPRVLWRAAGITAVATLALPLVLAAVWWSWRRLDSLLRTRVGEHIHGVEIKSFEVLRAASLRAALGTVSHVVRLLVCFSAVLVYLSVVFAQWPWTRRLSGHLVAFALAPVQMMAAAIVANIPNLVFLLVLFLVVRMILRIARLFFDAVRAGTVTIARFDPDWAQPTYNIVRIAVVAAALIIAYPYIPGSQSAAFKGVSLFIGVVFSFGSSSAISNMIAGYTMTYRRAFKLGDCVRIGDAVGRVVETRLQVTHLRSLKNEEIIIPNSQILSGEVLNYSSLARDPGLILHTEVGIGYETPWRQVEAMLLTAAGRTPGLAAERPAFVLIKKLGDFSVMYELNVYCRDATQMQHLYTLLHHHVLDEFNTYGVQIMTPAYEGDPMQPKVVPPDSWYVAPAAPQTQMAQPEKDRPTPAIA